MHLLFLINGHDFELLYIDLYQCVNGCILGSFDIIENIHIENDKPTNDVATYVESIGDKSFNKLPQSKYPECRTPRTECSTSESHYCQNKVCYPSAEPTNA